MKELSAVKYTEQKSRFYAHFYKIDKYSDIEELLKKHKRKYKKANHHCYAAIISEQDYFKDDGEVGHPGKAMLEILKKKELDSHLIIVSRIFGGIKLGVGGVTRAFRAACEGVIEIRKK